MARCIDKHTGKTHVIRWYWINHEGTRVRRNAIQVVAGFGWDVQCSCGWETRTGGAIHAYVQRLVETHKWDARNGFLDAHGQPTYV